jgi:hypothetical protein
MEKIRMKRGNKTSKSSREITTGINTHNLNCRRKRKEQKK